MKIRNSITRRTHMSRHGAAKPQPDRGGVPRAVAINFRPAIRNSFYREFAFVQVQQLSSVDCNLREQIKPAPESVTNPERRMVQKKGLGTASRPCAERRTRRRSVYLRHYNLRRQIKVTCSIRRPEYVQRKTAPSRCGVEGHAIRQT